MGCSGRSWCNANGVYRLMCSERGPPFAWEIRVEDTHWTDDFAFLNDWTFMFDRPRVWPGLNGPIRYVWQDPGEPEKYALFVWRRIVDHIHWFIYLHRTGGGARWYSHSQFRGWEGLFNIPLIWSHDENNFENGDPGTLRFRPLSYSRAPPDFCSGECSAWRDVGIF